MQNSVVAKMTIGITGSSGLVGSALVPSLLAAGHRVVSLRRERGRQGQSDRFVFPQDGPGPAFDAVVHLAGEPIASGRWTEAKKQRIRNSRIDGTRSLCEALALLSKPPRVLVCASAIGYYGNRGDELLDETSPPGTGFLAEVAQAWEQATAPAAQRGIRVACLRFGMILSRHGGALAKMLPPFRCGLGGRLGSGRQYWSWVAVDDAIQALQRVIIDDRFSGPINVVAPNPVRNAEFTKILGRILHRPVLANVPAWTVRLLFGRMGEELLLAGARVVPRRLIDRGCTFRHERLEEALRSLLADR